MRSTSTSTSSFLALTAPSLPVDRRLSALSPFCCDVVGCSGASDPGCATLLLSVLIRVLACIRAVPDCCCCCQTYCGDVAGQEYVSGPISHKRTPVTGV